MRRLLPAFIALSLALACACSAPSTNSSTSSSTGTTAPGGGGTTAPGPNAGTSPNGCGGAGPTEPPRPGAPVCGPASTVAPGEQNLLNATRGAWVGPLGTVVFQNDGTIVVSLRDCPTTPPVDATFGVHLDCQPGDVRGRFGVGILSLAVDPAYGTADVPSVPYGIYVDSKGLFHMGKGLVAEMGDDRIAVLVDDIAETSMQVTPDGCKFSPNGTDVVDAPCTWSTVAGVDVVTVDVPGSNGAPPTRQVYVYDRDAHVLAAAPVFVNAMERPTS